MKLNNISNNGLSVKARKVNFGSNFKASVNNTSSLGIFLFGLTRVLSFSNLKPLKNTKQHLQGGYWDGVPITGLRPATSYITGQISGFCSVSIMWSLNEGIIFSTAAHCLDQLQGNIVYYNGDSRYQLNCLQHPTYNKTLNNKYDIAACILPGFSSIYTTPICDLDYNTFNQNRSEYTGEIFGVGITGSDGYCDESVIGYRKSEQFNLNSLDSIYLNGIFYISYNPENPTLNYYVCPGDSGGPFMLYANSNECVWGIVSHGYSYTNGQHAYDGFAIFDHNRTQDFYCMQSQLINQNCSLYDLENDNSPSSNPSQQPNNNPTVIPTNQPQGSPSSQPSIQPVQSPLKNPSGSSTRFPSSSPAAIPTSQPQDFPSSHPSIQPIQLPLKNPSGSSTRFPSSSPAAISTKTPLVDYPSSKPSCQPSGSPTLESVNSDSSSSLNDNVFDTMSFYYVGASLLGVLFLLGTCLTVQFLRGTQIFSDNERRNDLSENQIVLQDEIDNYA